MDLDFIARVVRERRVLRAHERWSRAEIDRHQAVALGRLHGHATQHSRFYRRLYAGCETRPLEELPVLTKAQLMESFDDLVTVPDVRLADVRDFLFALDGYRLFQGRYWVAQTSGSTGNPCIFLWDRAEWTTIVPCYCWPFGRKRIASSFGSRDRRARAVRQHGQYPSAPIR